MTDASKTARWLPGMDGDPPPDYLVEEALASPVNWDGGGKTNNWRNYIHEPVRTLWETFTDQQKVALAMNASFEASMEEWE